MVDVLNLEFRYDPVRQQLRSLVLEGAVGQPVHVQHTTYMGIARKRPHGWLFERERGGGWLGAFGSHLVDFVRWTFGEIVNASGELRTAVTERPNASGELHPSSADDGFVAVLRTDRGVTVTVDSTSVAPANLAPHTVVVGTDAVLETEADRRVFRIIRDGRTEEPDPYPEGADRFALPMQRWVTAVRDAVRSGTVEAGLPTFADGLAMARVLDLLRTGA